MASATELAFQFQGKWRAAAMINGNSTAFIEKGFSGSLQKTLNDAELFRMY